MINLNKIVKLGCIALLTTVLLAGCADQSDNSKAISSSKARSEKLAKESSKKKEESKRKASEAESERKASKASAEAESESKVSEAQSSSEQSMASDQQQAQQASEQTSSEQTVSYGDLPPFDGTLSDFVNKYGVTPVVYKVQHYGMSVDEALQSTPDELQTSGEIQTEAGY